MHTMHPPAWPSLQKLIIYFTDADVTAAGSAVETNHKYNTANSLETFFIRNLCELFYKKKKKLDLRGSIEFV